MAVGSKKGNKKHRLNRVVERENAKQTRAAGVYVLPSRTVDGCICPSNPFEENKDETVIDGEPRPTRERKKDRQAIVTTVAVTGVQDSRFSSAKTTVCRPLRFTRMHLKYFFRAAPFEEKVERTLLSACIPVK